MSHLPLSGAQVVTESGYGDSKMYALDANTELSCKLIHDEATCLPGAANNSPLIERLLESEKQRNAAVSEVYALKAKLKKVEEAHTTLDTAFTV